jgi:hypothetical protein
MVAKLALRLCVGALILCNGCQAHLEILCWCPDPVKDRYVVPL